MGRRAPGPVLFLIAILVACGGTSKPASAHASAWTHKVCAAIDTYSRDSFTVAMKLARGRETTGEEEFSVEQAYTLNEIDAFTPLRNALTAALRAAAPPPGAENLQNAFLAAPDPSYEQTRAAVQRATDQEALDAALADLARGAARWRQRIATEVHALQGRAEWTDSVPRLIECVDVPGYDSPRALYDKLVAAKFACIDYRIEEAESDENADTVDPLDEATATCTHGGTTLDISTYPSDAARQDDLLGALMFGCSADESASKLTYVHGPGWLITNFMIEAGSASDFPATRLAEITGGQIHEVDCGVIRDAELPKSDNLSDWQKFIDRLLGENTAGSTVTTVGLAAAKPSP